MHSAESLSKEGEKFGKTSAFRAISQVWVEHSCVGLVFMVQRSCLTVYHLCRAWRPWRRRSTRATPVLTEPPLSWGNEAISPPKEPTAAPECSRPMSEQSLALESVFSSSVKLYPLFVVVASLNHWHNCDDGCPAGRQWESSSTRTQSGSNSGRTSRTTMSYSTVSQAYGFISFDPVDVMLYNRWATTCRSLMFSSNRGQHRADSRAKRSQMFSRLRTLSSLRVWRVWGCSSNGSWFPQGSLRWRWNMTRATTPSSELPEL